MRDRQHKIESSLIPNYHKEIEKVAERAYQRGLLAGINAQSMAQTKNEVMAFEDYGWDVDP